MPKYAVYVKSEQMVSEEIKLLIEANSEEEAQHKTEEALQQYPKPTTVEGISRILTVKVEHGQREILFIKMKEEKRA